MDEHDWLAERFEDNRTHLRAVAYRMLGSLERGGRRRPGSLAAAQPLRRQRRREPGRMADDGGRAGVPGHAALAQVAARGAARRATCPSRSRAAGDRSRPRAGGAAGRLGRARAAGGARDAGARRAAGVRAARHVRPCPSTRSRPSWGAPRPRPGSSPAAPAAGCRARPPAPDADLTRQREVVDAFLAASRGGDFDALLAVLDPDVVLRADRAAVPPGAPARGPRRGGRGQATFSRRAPGSRSRRS